MPKPTPSEPLRLTGIHRIVCLALLAWSCWWYLLGGFDRSQQQLRIAVPPLRDTTLSFFWMPVLFMLPAALLCAYIGLLGRRRRR